MIRTTAVIIARLLLVLLAWTLVPSAAQAANCYVATAQGTTGPSDWQTFCWIDFSSYNNTTASTGSGQSFSITLQDGTVMSFLLKTSGSALTGIASPSWTGAAIGNTAMTGIAGAPVLYQNAAGTTTVTVSSITLTPPSGATGVTNYMMVLADGESSNGGESLTFTTNGGVWQTLDQAGPISGSIYPTLSGTGTTTVTETGVDGTVGAYVFGSAKPTQVSTTLVGGGLQGFMMAVRFASVRLTMGITGARVNSADQFTYAVQATSNSAVLASGTSSGTGLGPFTTAGLSTAASVPLTLAETMAAGSSSTLADYRTSLTCTNTTSGSPTTLPSGVVTTSYSLGNLAYGDALLCTFTAIPFPHLTLKKALGTNGRRFTGDQFTMTIAQGGTTVATTTTTGTGTTVNTGTTAQTLVSAGSAYTFSETPSGTTQANQYTTTMACTNGYTGSTTTLPTTPGGSVTPALGDVISCTITNTRLNANALLTISKSAALVSDPVNGTSNPKSIPGAIVAYTLTVSNSGPSAVDNNSVLIIDTLPTQLSVGTAASPSFAQGSPTSNLTFSTTNDIAFSKAATAPTTFAGCNYTPVATYDPLVRFICLNPKGTMAGSTGTPPNFSITIQAKLN
ncbi:hypothetical protein [Novosphingobium sp.]|uniref:hypothetical protein n=1 Tax=Novosphingobium sp. TaxID=1874826 RepID=UPI003342829D